MTSVAAKLSGTPTMVKLAPLASLDESPAASYAVTWMRAKVVATFGTIQLNECAPPEPVAQDLDHDGDGDEDRHPDPGAVDAHPHADPAHPDAHPDRRPHPVAVPPPVTPPGGAWPAPGRTPPIPAG